MNTKEASEQLYEYPANATGRQTDLSVKTVLNWVFDPERFGHFIDKEGAIRLLSDEIIILTNYLAAIAVLRDAIKESE